MKLEDVIFKEEEIVQKVNGIRLNIINATCKIEESRRKIDEANKAIVFYENELINQKVKHLKENGWQEFIFRSMTQRALCGMPDRLGHPSAALVMPATLACLETQPNANKMWL